MRLNSYELVENSPREVADILGWGEGLEVRDLISALIYALGRIAQLESQMERLAPPRRTPGLDEALNSGDGTYRP